MHRIIKPGRGAPCPIRVGTSMLSSRRMRVAPGPMRPSSSRVRSSTASGRRNGRPGTHGRPDDRARSGRRAGVVGPLAPVAPGGRRAHRVVRGSPGETARLRRSRWSACSGFGSGESATRREFRAARIPGAGSGADRPGDFDSQLGDRKTCLGHEDHAGRLLGVGRRCRGSALARLRQRAALGKPERTWQGHGKHKVTAELQLACDQESLGAGSTAD